jgi:hypothetical protein
MSSSSELGRSKTADYLLATTAAVLAIVGAPTALFAKGPVLGLVLTVAGVAVTVAFLIRQDVIPFTVLRVVPGFRPTNPQDIKEQYAARRAKIRERYPLRDPHDREATRRWGNRSAKLAELARRYSRQGDMHWGRATERRQLQAAWAYATSGWIYERAVRISAPDSERPSDVEEDLPRRLCSEAADAYHYAANSFRVAGAYRQAILYYRKSHCCDPPGSPMKARSLYRALGVAELGGDLDEIDEIRKEIEAYRRTVG